MNRKDKLIIILLFCFALPIAAQKKEQSFSRATSEQAVVRALDTTLDSLYNRNCGIPFGYNPEKDLVNEIFAQYKNSPYVLTGIARAYTNLSYANADMDLLRSDSCYTYWRDYVLDNYPNYAGIYILMGDFEKRKCGGAIYGADSAAVWYEKAIEVDPKCTEAYNRFVDARMFVSGREQMKAEGKMEDASYLVNVAGVARPNSADSAAVLKYADRIAAEATTVGMALTAAQMYSYFDNKQREVAACYDKIKREQLSEHGLQNYAGSLYSISYTQSSQEYNDKSLDVCNYGMNKYPKNIEYVRMAMFNYVLKGEKETDKQQKDDYYQKAVDFGDRLFALAQDTAIIVEDYLYYGQAKQDLHHNDEAIDAYKHCLDKNIKARNEAVNRNRAANMINNIYKADINTHKNLAEWDEAAKLYREYFDVLYSNGRRTDAFKLYDDMATMYADAWQMAYEEHQTNEEQIEIMKSGSAVYDEYIKKLEADTVTFEETSKVNKIAVCKYYDWDSFKNKIGILNKDIDYRANTAEDVVEYTLAINSSDRSSVATQIIGVLIGGTGNFDGLWKYYNDKRDKRMTLFYIDEYLKLDPNNDSFKSIRKSIARGVFVK